MNDAHTALLAPSPKERYMLGSVRAIKGKAVVTRVRDDIAVPGLERGAVITGRGDLTVAQYLGTLEPWQIAGSTERQRLQSGYLNLMVAAAGENIELTHLDAQGKSRRAELTGAPPEAPPTGGSPLQEGAGQVIEGKRLGSGLGYINIPTFRKGGGRSRGRI